MATFTRFFMKRITGQPEKIRLYGVFQASAGKNVRLVKVDNTTEGTIECFYQEYSDTDPAYANAGPRFPKDEFNYPHSSISSDVNVNLIGDSGNPKDTMNTDDAPIL